jgi:cell division protein FtsB
VSVRATTIERTRPRLTARAAALLIVLALLAFFAISPVRELMDERAKVALLERQAQTLENANAKLRADIAKLHDPDELERLARGCLGMVMPGETALVTVPKHGVHALASC